MYSSPTGVNTGENAGVNAGVTRESPGNCTQKLKYKKYAGILTPRWNSHVSCYNYRVTPVFHYILGHSSKPLDCLYRYRHVEMWNFVDLLTLNHQSDRHETIKTDNFFSTRNPNLKRNPNFQKKSKISMFSKMSPEHI